MQLITRSLLLALLACFSMVLFAKSMLDWNRFWIPIVFLLATFALAVEGVRLGVRGARQQRRWQAWLAPGLNAFLIVAFVVLLVIFVQALKRIS